jgi:iron complex outermembrane receptor protein
VAALEQETERSTLSLAPYLVLRSLRLRQNYTGFLSDPSGDSQEQQNDDVVVGGK